MRATIKEQPKVELTRPALNPAICRTKAQKRVKKGIVYHDAN
jgi:hypothetical protein